MKLKIKDLTVHSYRCFDGNWTKYEKLEAHNELSPEDRKSLEATKKDTLNQIYKMMEG